MEFWQTSHIGNVKIGFNFHTITMRGDRLPKQLETTSVNEKLIAGTRYRTDETGVIHLYDSFTGDEISISDQEMNTQDRIDYFSAISDVLQESLPEGAQVVEENNTIMIMSEHYVEGDKPLGTITGKSGRFSTEGGGLVIEWIGSEVKNGGTILLAELLKKYPDTKEIYGELDHTNFAVYRDSRQKGNSHEEALRHTPAYKSRAICGFNEIKPQEREFNERLRPILVTAPRTLKTRK